jgi:anthranilate 1,2-dioxygenase large subunit
VAPRRPPTRYSWIRSIAGAADEEAVIEMGGAGTDSSESRVTEASVRGFWKAYRAQMGL